MNESLARTEALALMEEREGRPVHVQHVAKLALSLYDQLAELHALGPRERILLEMAGCLHDIGHRSAPGGKGHHLESARVIREHAWKGITPAEAEIVAQVARYHRKEMPELSHHEFSTLSFTDRKLVQKLGAFVRLSDALDRTHEQLITDIRVELKVNQILLHLTITGPVLYELQAARSKADLAEAVFQRDILFMVDDEELMARQ